MGTPKSRSSRSLGRLPDQKALHPVKKRVGDVVKLSGLKDVRGRPSNAGSCGGVDLPKADAKGLRKIPKPDDSLTGADTGTHDVNDEVIADAYRRGLRVHRMAKLSSRSLVAVFG